MLKIPNKDNILIDNYGRKIDYLRISVTDRCNLRCTYCMPEKMKFMSKKDILSFDEMYELCEHFIARGIKKIRITGGEPLVRKGILEFINNLKSFKNMNMIGMFLGTTGAGVIIDILINNGVEFPYTKTLLSFTILSGFSIPLFFFAGIKYKEEIDKVTIAEEG